MSNLFKYLIKTSVLFLLFHITIFSQGVKFVHTADSSNIDGNFTIIDHPLLNNNPSAVFLITQNWNPTGYPGVYNDAPVGVWYYSLEGKWSIFNQDYSFMPSGASFNVFIPNGSNYFVHTANDSNIVSNWTTIDHPSLNGDPAANLFVTQNWNPPGSPGIYNNANIGVWYFSSLWTIFNQNRNPIPQGASFNVFYYNGSDAFVHTADSSNIIAHVTYIDHPELNNNQDAIFFITPRWEGVYNDSPIGVFYETPQSKWAIFNQNFTIMPQDAKFNVYLAKSGVTDADENNENKAALPEEFYLTQNYPNPFNPTTKIRFTIPADLNQSSSASEVRTILKVYDLLGNEVATLVDEQKPAGVYEVQFDANGLSSGVYFYKISAGKYSAIKKMILMK